ncbi:FAD-binding oxidoreductase [Tropicimonas sp. IMCC34043]|uniref:NAD(P)/FAD-dependent oxidoreductase n=1 Tax=Tropicimonas sp. IMCC34043 TaxID=2248760 RepID=UPI000E2305D7|nr:FAD-binding oxidoreductase [Tropicimonas sp. IMCC34043]
MAPITRPVQTATELPKSTTVVVIGGGIVGMTAALNLAERGIPVTVLEKGRVAGEQSSRNLGWIRKTSRAAIDVPMAVAADRLWAGMHQRIGADVGYRQKGIMFVAGTEATLETYRKWLASVQDFQLDSRIVSAAEIKDLVPEGAGKWEGGIYTASDGRAEPTIATSEIARAAIEKGAVVLENCAVRTVTRSAGKLSGVVTEKGEIACDQVILAGGLWSRRFLGNMGLSLPTLPLNCNVVQTAPMEGPTEIAVGGPDFSFCRRIDGRYTICQRGAMDSTLVLDHALLGLRYLPTLREARGVMRIRLGKEFVDDLKLARRWKPTSVSPFEKLRTMDPRAIDGINAEAMENASTAWPVFAQAEVERTWAGTMDITPDSNPVIDRVAACPGLTLATGFSGHGFGTGPAAGQLAADLATGAAPLVDPAPYRFDRF